MKKTISFTDIQKEVDDTTEIYKPIKNYNNNKIQYNTYTENINIPIDHNKSESSLLFRNMEGISYNQTRRWKDYIPFNKEFLNINYLHIGSVYDPTIYSFIQSYGHHPLSNIHCVDYNIVNNIDVSFFYKNIENINSYPQINVYCMFSNKIFENINYKYFDVIFFNEGMSISQFLPYFDTCYSKLKNKGYIIFEGYLWYNMDKKRKCIDTVLSFYKNEIKYLGNDDNNLFIMKM